MKRNLNILIGLALVGLGLVYLLQNFNVIPRLDFAWPIVFAAAGFAFLAAYATNRRHWWPLIPGFTLLGLAAASGSSVFFPRWENQLGGAFFLGMLSLGFWAIYAFHRENWWAIIPGGVLSTLAVVAAAGERYGGDATATIFFLGLAATFTILWIAARQTWAVFPAAGLVALGLFIFAGWERFLNYLWPALLILAGAFLLVRALRPSTR